MGYANAQQVMVRWSHLDHRAVRCLLAMALAARDKPGTHGEPAGVYWGGHEVLAWSLGLTDWDQDPSPNALRTVRRVITGLVDNGAVKPLGRPHPGHRAEYQLTLGP